MQHFNTLWQQPQKIIFDLGNIFDSTYTGIWHTTLTATFFTIPDSPPTADQILPISAKQSAANMGSVFQIPDQVATTAYSLPNNVERAVVSLAYCGQIGEEFWYSNVFNSDVDTVCQSFLDLSHADHLIAVPQHYWNTVGTRDVERDSIAD